MKVFVDDLRECPERYELFRSAEDFLAWRQKNNDVEIDILALDHDLGENCLNGYELVQELVESTRMDNIKTIIFHTDNLIGMKNMYYYLSNAQKHGIISENIVINPNKYNCLDGKFTHSLYRIIK